MLTEIIELIKPIIEILATLYRNPKYLASHISSGNVIIFIFSLQPRRLQRKLPFKSLYSYLLIICARKNRNGLQIRLIFKYAKY